MQFAVARATATNRFALGPSMVDQRTESEVTAHSIMVARSRGDRSSRATDGSLIHDDDTGPSLVAVARSASVRPGQRLSGPRRRRAAEDGRIRTIGDMLHVRVVAAAD